MRINMNDVSVASLPTFENGCTYTVPFWTVHWPQTLTLPTTECPAGEYHSEYNSRVDSFGNPLEGLAKFAAGNFVDVSKQDAPLVQLMWNGQETMHGVPACFIPTKAEQKQALRSRVDQVAIWRESSDPAIANLATFAGRYWGLVDEDDNPLPLKDCPLPLLIGNMGYRRAMAFMGVLSANDTVSDLFDVKVVHYASKAERHLAQLAENGNKDAGRAKMSEADNLHSACRLVLENASEKDVCKVMKRGAAQKAYAIACLDLRFPTVELVARTYLPAPGGEYSYGEGCPVPLPKLNGNYARCLNKGGTHNSDKVTAADKPEVVESWVKSSIVGSANKPKFDKTGLETMSTNSPVELLRVVALALLEKDTVTIAAINGCAKDINPLLADFVADLVDDQDTNE